MKRAESLRCEAPVRDVPLALSEPACSFLSGAAPLAAVAGALPAMCDVRLAVSEQRVREGREARERTFVDDVPHLDLDRVVGCCVRVRARSRQHSRPCAVHRAPCVLL